MVNKATVKNVLSGDTVILRGKPRANGPPAERLLALSNVQAPRLGNTTRSDEVSFFSFIFLFFFPKYSSSEIAFWLWCT